MVHYNTKTTYSVEKNLSDEEKNNHWKVAFAEKLKKDIETLEYVLKIDDHKSEFELIEKLRFSDYKTNSMAFVQSGQRYYVDENQFIEQLNHSGQDFLIIEKANNFDWKLKNESKKILGFTCYLTTYETTGDFGVKIDAWYSPQIAYPFGPKGYHGLPGLILEINRNEILTNTASKIEYDKELIIIKPTTGQKVTRAQFNSMIQNTVKEMKRY